jgi:hypothetical protein
LAVSGSECDLDGISGHFGGWCSRTTRARPQAGQRGDQGRAGGGPQSSDRRVYRLVSQDRPNLVTGDDRQGADRALSPSPERLLDTYKASKAALDEAIMFSHGGPRYLFDFRRFDELTFDTELYAPKRVIHLVRDIRDTLVSYYFQLAKREQLFTGDMSAFLRDPIFGARKIIAYYTLWFRHHRQTRDFMLLRYEAMRRDPIEALIPALDFLGIAGASEVAPSAVEFASFENMRRMEQTGGFKRKMMQPGQSGDQESYKVRKGKVGGFTEYLSPENLAYIDTQLAELGDPGCDWYLKPA